MTVHSQEANIARYVAAIHAMQSGIAMEMEQGSTDTHPKHLRVGVNSSLLSQSALTSLLIAKGIITSDEYYDALADAAESEVEAYEVRLSERTRSKVTLR